MNRLFRVLWWISIILVFLAAVFFTLWIVLAFILISLVLGVIIVIRSRFRRKKSPPAYYPPVHGEIHDIHYDRDTDKENGPV